MKLGVAAFLALAGCAFAPSGGRQYVETDAGDDAADAPAESSPATASPPSPSPGDRCAVSCGGGGGGGRDGTPKEI